MSFFHADRVAETSTSTGNTTLSLAGAVTGFRTFTSATGGVAAYVYCSVVNRGASEWQIARYSFNGTNTLTFDTLISSSTGSTITFTAGTKDVFLVHPSMLFPNGSTVPGGRLTTESNVPVSTTDRTAQSTVYYTPYSSDIIHLWEGANAAGSGAWRPFYFTEISGSISALTSGFNYDVFVYNSGTAATPVLALSFVGWGTDTTRVAGVLTRVGSAYLYTNDFKYRYVGTIRVSGSGTTEDSLINRYVWNYYNSVPRAMTKVESTTSWTMTGLATGVARSANNNTANALSIVSGFDNYSIYIVSRTMAGASASSRFSGGIGINQNTAYTSAGTNNGWACFQTVRANTPAVITCSAYGLTRLGLNTYYWLEWASTGVTTTFYGSSQYGLHGVWPC